MSKHLLSACLAAAVLAAGAPPAGATVLNVGAGQTYVTLAAAVAAARPNDVIDVHPGDYINQAAVIGIPLTIQGVGGTPVFSATRNIANRKGFLVIDATATVDNIAFMGARVADGNGAGIRYEKGDLVVSNSRFTGNQDGILATPLIPGTGSLLIENSLFQDNGVASGPFAGLAHSVYANRLVSLTVENSTFQGTRVGHDVKSRAATTTVTGSTLDDGVTGTTSYAIDISNGGRAIIRGNAITQGVHTENNAMVSYAAEGLAYADNLLQVAGNVFDNMLAGGSVGVFNRARSVTADVSCNAFNGVATPVAGSANLYENAFNAPLPRCASVGEPAAWALLLPACLGLLCLRPRISTHV